MIEAERWQLRRREWIPFEIFNSLNMKKLFLMAHLQSSVFKLSKDLIDSIHEEGIVAYTS